MAKQNVRSREFVVTKGNVESEEDLTRNYKKTRLSLSDTKQKNVSIAKNLDNVLLSVKKTMKK